MAVDPQKVQSHMPIREREDQIQFFIHHLLTNSLFKLDWIGGLFAVNSEKQLHPLEAATTSLFNTTSAFILVFF